MSIRKKYVKSFPFIILLIISILGYKLLTKSPSSSEVKQPKIVEVQKVKRGDIQQTVRLVGTLNPRHSSLFRAPGRGTLNILIPSGQRVVKGTLIAEIEDKTAAENEQLVEKYEKIAKERLDRAQHLYDKHHLSKSTVEEKKRLWIEAQRSLSETISKNNKLKFTAPFTGTLGLYKVSQGAQVKENDPIVSFFDTIQGRVSFNIPMPLISHVQVGQLVIIQNKPYALTNLQSVIDDETHMIPAYVDVDALEGFMGSDLEVELVVQQQRQVIVVPRDAVFLRKGLSSVYCVEKNKVQWKTVEVGVQEKTEVEILEGLSEGELLIIQGQSRLFPDEDVRVHKPEDIITAESRP